MNKKYLLLLLLAGIFVAGCSSEIKPSEHTQKLMDEQRAAQMGKGSSVPSQGAPPGTPMTRSGTGTASGSPR